MAHRPAPMLACNDETRCLGRLIQLIPQDSPDTDVRGNTNAAKSIYWPRRAEPFEGNARCLTVADYPCKDNAVRRGTA